jgi:Tol biopolymer transport system component
MYLLTSFIVILSSLLSTLPVATKAIAGSLSLIRGVIIIIFASSIFTVCPLSNQSAFGTFPGENGKIVFIDYGDNTSAGIIYVINANGSGQTRLSTDDDDDDANSKDYRAEWSPDGTKIAFASYRDGNFEIYVMNAADGSGQTNISNNPAYDFGPEWSPDGTKIAFFSQRDDDNNDIYVMNANGSGQTRLTNNTAADADDFGPEWSPDGTKIAFASDRDAIDIHHDIYVMNANGSGQTRLTDSSADETWSSWSPDGTKIVFESLLNEVGGIYVVNAADGSNRNRLTTSSSGDDSNPKWSPDGTKIAFDSNE